jgi:hypothetical protein
MCTVLLPPGVNPTAVKNKGYIHLTAIGYNTSRQYNIRTMNSKIHRRKRVTQSSTMS